MRSLMRQLLFVAAVSLLVTGVAVAQTPLPTVSAVHGEGILAPVGGTVAMQAPPQTTVGVQSDSLKNRLTLSVLWGPDNQFSGKVIKAGSGVYQDTIPINFTETNYDAVYGKIGLFKIGVGYRMKPRMETTVNFVLSRSSSQPVQVGTVGTQNAPLTAVFDDYSYWGVEAGQRFYFTRVRLTPFAGYNLGINRFTHINGTFTAPAMNTQPAVNITDGQFFDSSWAFSFGPTGGVLVGLGPVELQAELALRFMGGLSDVDPLSQANLKDINSESSRWSFPLLFGARIRF